VVGLHLEQMAGMTGKFRHKNFKKKRTCTGFFWLSRPYVPLAGSCDYGDEHSGCKKGVEFTD
jgi:hypothetical protein